MTSPGRAEVVVSGWARHYTRGMPDEVASRRLDELASDCHEQRCWGREVGASPVVVAISMVARTTAGIPADLHWRHTQIAATQDRSLNERGRSMRQQFRHNWWLALAGLAAAMEVALGVLIPLEDRTVGSVIGGIIIAGLGVVSLTGLIVRRNRRTLGDAMIAVGMLPLMPFLWTVVLPVVGMTVIVAATVDATHAQALGAPPQRPDQRRRDPTLSALVAVLIAVVVAAIVVGDPATAILLVSPVVTGLLVYLAFRHRLPGAPLTRIGLVLVLTSLGSQVVGGLGVLALVVTGESVQLGDGPSYLVGSVLTALLVIGAALLLIGFRRARQARPA